MAGFKDPGFLERKSAATDARKAALEKFRANSAANNPAVAERQAAREAASKAREERAAITPRHSQKWAPAVIKRSSPTDELPCRVGSTSFLLAFSEYL